MLKSRAKTIARSGAAGAAKRRRGRPPVFSRSDILKAAKTAFSQRGYANVSLDDLAAKLKTGKGTLYYHSSRKVDLLVTISREIISASLAGLRRIEALPEPAEARFRMAFHAHMDSILSDIPASKIYFENEADLPPPVRRELRAVLREIEDIFAGIAQEGVERGAFKGEARIAVRHAMAVSAWAYRWYSPAGRLSREAFVDNAADFVMAALRGEKSL